jgi:thienamycin biosynthesis protein ThnN
MFDAYDRYIQHIWDQVVDIVRYQDVGVLFATSRLLEMMPEKVDLKLFANLKGIVHAGTTLTRDTNRILQQELFPGVPQVGVYGTSTTSVSFQKPPGPEDDFRVIYIPSSPFVTLEIVDDNGNKVPPGSEGHVATYRLTQDSLIPGFWERDRAIRVEPYGKHAGDFAWSWIEGPYSPEFTTGKKVEGVY